MTTTNESLITEIEEILRSAGYAYDGGNAETRRDLAEEWAAHCDTAAEVAAWVASGCWDADTAAELWGAGFDPTCAELAYRPGHERDGMTAMYALCNGDTSLKKLTW